MQVDVEIDDAPRGCGNLVPGGYYLSAVECTSAMGALQAVTFPFGDGLNEVVSCAGSVPARGMLRINPAATFATKSIVRFETPVNETAIGAEYGRLAQAVLTEGLADHVGSRHYTAKAFAAELFERMPNRRVHPDVARQLAGRLPLPVVFTHSQIPWFRSQEEIEQAMEYCYEFMDRERVLHYGANWLREEWGIFARQDDGRDHFMLPILGLLDKLRRDWRHLSRVPYWQEVRGFFDSLQYEEQPFAISWFVRAIRIVDEDHPPTQEDADAGIVAAKAVGDAAHA